MAGEGEEQRVASKIFTAKDAKEFRKVRKENRWDSSRPRFLQRVLQRIRQDGRDARPTLVSCSAWRWLSSATPDWRRFHSG